MQEAACRIPLSRGLYALIDQADFDRVSAFKWSALPQKHTTYAQRHAGEKWVMLHRFILDAQPGQIVDHANGLGTDCRRSNLRLCTHSQNNTNCRRATNQNGFRGVNKNKNRYNARIKFSKKLIYLGSFLTAEGAAQAYDSAAKTIFGEFAFLNFPGSV